MDRIKVVAGILVDGYRRILLAQRSNRKHQANKWEFPGGKIEEGEEPGHALSRELWEELGIKFDMSNCQLFQHFIYDYQDKQVSLFFYKIKYFTGIPKGMEGQPLSWVGIQQFQNYDLPNANKRV